MRRRWKPIPDANKPILVFMKIDADKILQQRISGGDVSAMEVLYVCFAPRIKAFLRRTVSGIEAEDVEDITHDIMMKVWSGRAGLSEVKSLPSFMFEMSRNAALDLLKHRKAAGRYAEYRKMQPDSSSPADELEARDALREVMGEMDRLDGRGREIFLMNRRDGKTYSEISETLHISPRTVQYHISRILRRLRNLF